MRIGLLIPDEGHTPAYHCNDETAISRCIFSYVHPLLFAGNVINFLKVILPGVYLI
jgi:hypothetical protein